LTSIQAGTIFLYERFLLRETKGGGGEARLRVGRKVRALRLQRGLSLQALADQLQLSKTHLCLFEQGKRVPSEATVRRLARFFGEDEDAWAFAVREAPRIERIRRRYPKLARAFLTKVLKGRKGGTGRGEGKGG